MCSYTSFREVVTPGDAIRNMNHPTRQMNILMIVLRNNKDMFVYNPDDRESRYNPVVQLGMPYIAAYLKQEGFDVTGLNLNDEPGLIRDVIQNYLAENKYDMIFTGGTSLFYHNCKDLIKYLREFSEAKIVVGGGLVSAKPEMMIKMLKPDFIIRYEGEITAAELVKAIRDNKPLSEIDGICYTTRDGWIVTTSPRKLIQDLDSLPYPDFDAFDFSKQIEQFKPAYIAYDHTDKPRPYSIIASRGCPWQCSFCFHTIGKGYRQRSVDNIMGEIQYAIDKYKANVIFFNDELFSYDKPRTLEICRRIKEIKARTPWEITVMANNRVDKIDDEILDAVCNDMGCNIVGFGLESYSNTVLKSMRKHITAEQIQKAISGVSDRGCVVQGSFIFGDPAETLATAQETLDYYTNNQDVIKNAAKLDFIMAFPGAPVWEDAVARGIIKDEADFIENKAAQTYNRITPLNLTHLSDNDFEILKNRVFTAEYVTHRSARPMRYTCDGEERMFALCPYCHNPQEYRNITFPSFVGCRNCNGRYYLAPWWYKLSQAIVKVIGFNAANRLREIFT